MEAGSSVKSTLLSLMSSQQEEYLAVFCRHTTVLPDTALLPAHAARLQMHCVAGRILLVCVLCVQCVCAWCVCVLFMFCHWCFVVFSSHSFWTSSSLDVPAGVTQEKGHTRFSSTFFLRCVPYFFSREGFSHSFPSSTVKSKLVY